MSIDQRRPAQPPEQQKTDGWLAGIESDALPHDKTRTFGDGAPEL
jgi:hypothetical protein